MVQRKVTSKLGIQADQVKTNKLLSNLKPSSSFQHQDAKNKGADLKKKMKKSRPTKCSDAERLGSVNMMRQVPQPGKPPPPVFPKPVASPQKKSPVKISEATPNYMKSTSSSDARKEQPQVSSRNLQTVFDSKSSNSKKSNCAKISSSSVPKAARILARTSSLKLMRTLTKTTSFKPARTSAKRCSPLVLRESINAQRATCSSTQKDSKFPAYLELSSGGTESDGISVVNVCPYTYCSLNGHHHAPLPPLRSVLSARRRMVKAQRGMKLGCTSPRRSNPTSNIMKEGQAEQMNFDEPSPNEKASSGSITSTITEENHRDFFVQIYSKERVATREITEFFNHIRPLVEEIHSDNEKAAQLDNHQVLEILSDEFPFFEIDSNEDGSENYDAISTNMEAEGWYNDEVNQNKEVEEGHSLFPTQEKASKESVILSHHEVEDREIIPIDNTAFGFSDMDWEVENHSPMFDYEAGNSLQITQHFDLQEEAIKFGSCVVPNGKSILMVDDIVISCFKEIQSGGFLQQSLDEEVFDEGSVSSKGDSYRSFEIEEYVEGPDDTSNDQLWGLAKMVAEDGTVEPEECGKMIINASLISLDKPIQEPCSADSDVSKSYLQDDDAAGEIWDPNSQDFHDIIEQNSKEGCKGPTGKEEDDPCQFDVNSSNSTPESEEANGRISPQGKNSDAMIEDEEKEQVDFGKASTSIEIRSFLQDASEATKYTSGEELDDNYLEPLVIDAKSDETLTGEETTPISTRTSGNRRMIDILGRKKYQELTETCFKLKGRNGSKRFVEENKEPKDFNPRGPNFLPGEPDPEAEKVDLKHQMIDERKNADEWMLDYAIRQAVTKLGTVRKKKVALLVEAFETVMPVPRFETQQRHASVAFAHAQTIRACS